MFGIICDLFILIFANTVALWEIVQFSIIYKITFTAVFFSLYLTYIFIPHGKESLSRKLKILDSGAYITGHGTVLSVLQIAANIFLIFTDLSIWRIIGNAFMAYAVILIMCLSGVVRILAASRQFKPILYILLFMLWYVPIVNCFIFFRFYKRARSEYRFEQAKLDLDETRKESEVCKTKYPILMVHGIFFRDYQHLNYWGRIPGALIKNGAEIYYGSQQSANKVAVSAGELAQKIEEIIAKTGAEKVNIIAHSKGGLDSRYAITHLGMDKYVASLTTINTPHRGCKFVDRILKKAPLWLVNSLDKKYNKLFTALGDESPHFYEGLAELTYESCEKMNKETPDMAGVYYHAVMSRMRSGLSAGFPLNIGYYLNKPHDKNGNDGLVTVESGMYWDDPFFIEHSGRRGISHGDVIDLFRENIPGYDVREFYVKLVSDLKSKGF